MPGGTAFKLNEFVLREAGPGQESNGNDMPAFGPPVSSGMVFIHHWLLGFAEGKGVEKKKSYAANGGQKFFELARHLYGNFPKEAGNGPSAKQISPFWRTDGGWRQKFRVDRVRAG